jgi:PAS domain S-box-containing protein
LAPGTNDVNARCYRDLVENLADYAIFLFDERGRVLSWNPGAERIFGYSAAEMIGRSYDRLFTPEDRAAGLPRREMEQAAARGRTPDERWHVCKDGSRFFATGAVLALDGGGGAVARYAKVLHDTTVHRQTRIRLETELAREQRIARTLQGAMLPDIPEDAFPGLAVASRYQAALQEANVGGDFYDAFRLLSGRIALVVGDVSGKGLAAAGRTAEIRHALRAFLREGGGETEADAARAVARLNNFVCDAQRLDAPGADAFTVLSLALVDPASGAATFVLAGAEPALLLRADGGAVDLVESGGLILGVEPGESYEAVSERLLPGDTLLMATDGITEARRGNDFFGLDGMAAAAAEAARRSSGAVGPMSHAIVEVARAFADGLLRDDACLLLAQRRR